MTRRFELNPGHEWIAAVLTWMIMTGLVVSITAKPWAILDVVMTDGIVYAATLVLLIRCGLTSALVGLAIGDFLWRAPAGLDFSAWYQNGGQIVALIVLLLALYNFHLALAGRRVLSGKLFSE